MATLTVHAPSGSDEALVITVEDPAVLAEIVRRVSAAFESGAGCWLNRDGDLQGLNDVVYWLPVGAVLVADYSEPQPFAIY